MRADMGTRCTILFDVETSKNTQILRSAALVLDNQYINELIGSRCASWIQYHHSERRREAVVAPTVRYVSDRINPCTITGVALALKSIVNRLPPTPSLVTVPITVPLNNT